MKFHSIGVIGGGFVGGAVGRYFEKRGHPVRTYDKFKEIDPLEEVLLQDFIFVAVPTPYQDGIDLSAMDDAMANVAKCPEGKKISVVTAYDAWSARLVARSRVDAILVGDSALLGFSSSGTHQLFRQRRAVAFLRYPVHRSIQQEAVARRQVLPELALLTHDDRDARQELFPAVARRTPEHS